MPPVPQPEVVSTDTQDALMAGAALVDPKSISMPTDPEACTPFVVVPTGFTVESLARLFPKPQRRRGNTVLLDEDSFISAVQFEVDMNSAHVRLFGTKMPATITAVFNDEGYGDHTASYACPLSRQWKTWIAKNKQPMNQVDFATFIEDNRLDITAPATAEMLEIAQNISVSSTGGFKSKINRVNGNIEFGFKEETDATAGYSGTLRVPEFFTLGIPVLDGGEKWEVTARLRYRLKDGLLSLWYDLDNHERVYETAINGVWQKIEDATYTRILHGVATTGRQ